MTSSLFMKRGVLVVIALVAAAALLVAAPRKQAVPAQAAEGAGPALRERFLALTPAEAGATPPSTPYGVWATAMDLSFDSGTATIVSTISGSASLYTSTGGGIIGGEAHANVRAAASGFVQAAEACAGQMTAGQVQPLPSPGHVRFYAHSKAGLLLSPEVSEEDLASGTHAFSPCYAAAQDVVTQLRQLKPDA